MINREENDIMHGRKYKSLKIDGTEISLCLFADAAPINASTKTSLSEMLSSIIELPQRIREAKEIIFFIAL